MYGRLSIRANEGKDYIMPYFVDENGKFTTRDTGIIGGTSISDDLLAEYIGRFVEVDGVIVKVGDEKIEGKFDYEQFGDIITQLDSNGCHK